MSADTVHMANPSEPAPHPSGGGRPGFRRASRFAGGVIVMAWLGSVVYHAIVFAIMNWVPWLASFVRTAGDQPPPFTQVVGIVDQPSFKLAASPRVDTPTRPSEIDPLDIEPTEFDAVDLTAAAKPEALNIIGIGTGGGELDKYGPSIASSAPGPTFFKLGGQARGARRIVYVVDRSGSMAVTLPGVIRELKESIGRLRRSQRFHVIFFNAGQPIENPPKRLVSAIPAHKRDAYDFFDAIAAGGSTDPIPAMRRAFAVEPDLIYFLTDGEFDARLLGVLQRLNRGKQVRIFTIAYVSPAGAPLLERIAREHNGEYRFVSESEIF